MKTIRRGMIGCGNVTEVKSGPAFRKIEGSRLLAVTGRTEERVRDYASRHRVPRWYPDARRMLADPEIEAVYIATPLFAPSVHADGGRSRKSGLRREAHGDRGDGHGSGRAGRRGRRWVPAGRADRRFRHADAGRRDVRWVRPHGGRASRDGRGARGRVRTCDSRPGSVWWSDRWRVQPDRLGRSGGPAGRCCRRRVRPCCRRSRAAGRRNGHGERTRRVGHGAAWRRDGGRRCSRRDGGVAGDAGSGWRDGRRLRSERDGRLGVGRRLAKRAAAILEQVGDRARQGQAICVQGFAYSHQSRAAESQQAAADALALAQACGDLQGQGNALNLLTYHMPDLALRLKRLHQALAVYKAAGVALGQAAIINNLGNAYMALGL